MRKFIGLFVLVFNLAYAQQDLKAPSDLVNVFMGTSGDYGQLSPGASYPFSMLSISPETYPSNHTGYDHRAKEFLGFTHTRLQGVGCKGSGGNILIKPILNDDINTALIKENEYGKPGFYSVDFANKIKAAFTVSHNFGIHRYSFLDNAQVFVDLSKSTQNAFVGAEYQVGNQFIEGKISTRTTCFEGVYHFYFYIDFGKEARIEKIDEYQFIVNFKSSNPEVKVGFSSVSKDYAKKRALNNLSFDEVENLAISKWNDLLSRADVEDTDRERVGLFYSLLYRTLQAPFLISEEDGAYRTISGEMKKADFNVYHGWAIWDNYREIIPLYSLLFPDIYQDIVKSIANLYPYGKKNFATQHEPAPTVRTEHALVVLADALSKGFSIPVESIKEFLIEEAEALEFSSPDKALESCYDLWALSEIFRSIGDNFKADFFLKKAATYKDYWTKDFKDITAKDVDVMQARGLYQGTIWQYRWLVPYDVKGLIDLIGSEKEFENQLDTFFKGHYYNHANQPDIQTSSLYNATHSPYKSQGLLHELLIGETIQFYFNDNSKGIDPYIGRIYKNEPQAFLRTMDDDLGTMSAWFILRSLGISAANVGSNMFYLTAPIFEKVRIRNSVGTEVELTNVNREAYICKMYLDEGVFQRNYISHEALLKAKKIEYQTKKSPCIEWPLEEPWISNIKSDE